MEVRARFRPHPRGFGFLIVVGADGRTPAPVEAVDADGGPRRVARAFVPPPLARTLLADDLVTADVDPGEERPACEEATLLARPRRLVAGVVERRRGGLVLLAERDVAVGPIALPGPLAARLDGALGEVAVVLVDAAASTPRGSALIAGPYPAQTPEAVRASAVAAVLGGASPSLADPGPEAVGLDAVVAETAHLRVAGQLAAGSARVASGLDRHGPVPGAAIAAIDRRGEPCLTVDGFASRDLDDAVAASWSGAADAPVRVAVHVTDVAVDVGLGSAADLHARTMGATAYLGGASAPMLGEDLSAAAGSLGAGQERRVLSARFDVAPDGHVTAVDLEPALIRSRARLSYSAVESWLAGDPTQLRAQARTQGEPVQGVLQAAAEASRRLAVARQARASLGVLFEPAALAPAVVDGELAAVAAEPHARAHDLVEQLMVAANEAVGLWLAERDAPALFRVHAGLDAEHRRRLAAAARRAGVELPDLDGDAGALTGAVLGAIGRLGAGGDGLPDPVGAGGRDLLDPAASGARDLLDPAEPGGRDLLDPAGPGGRDLLIAAAASSSARARYRSRPGPHRGLAAQAYCHFTSPLRRYADLVVHRQVRALLAGEAPPYRAGELDALATWLDARAGPLGRLEATERTGLWSLLLERGVIDGPETAVVTEVRPAGLRVRLPRLGLGGFLPAGALGGEEDALSAVDHGLASADERWQVGHRLAVRYAGSDEQGRIDWALAEGR
ncbi:MAG: ribonuclease catalytic domain-containing protein [Actinomycetota bacterium]